jgi:hypothetical protein
MASTMKGMSVPMIMNKSSKATKMIMGSPRMKHVR